MPVDQPVLPGRVLSVNHTPLPERYKIDSEQPLFLYDNHPVYRIEDTESEPALTCVAIDKQHLQKPEAAERFRTVATMIAQRK